MDRLRVERGPTRFGAQTRVELIHIPPATCHTLWPITPFGTLTTVPVRAWRFGGSTTGLRPTDNTRGLEKGRV